MLTYEDILKYEVPAYIIQISFILFICFVLFCIFILAVVKFKEALTINEIAWVPPLIIGLSLFIAFCSFSLELINLIVSPEIFAKEKAFNIQKHEEERQLELKLKQCKNTFTKETIK